MNADDVPDPQATGKHPQVTDEQLVINATEKLSQCWCSSPSTEQQLQSRIKELEKELEAIQKDRAWDQEHGALLLMKSNFSFKEDQLSDDDKKGKLLYIKEPFAYLVLVVCLSH